MVALVRHDNQCSNAVVDFLPYYSNVRHLEQRIRALPDDSLEADIYRNLLQQWVMAPPPS